MTEFYLCDLDGRRFQGTPTDPIGDFFAIAHDCPFCGQKASQGRSLVWIAIECIENGKAIFPCQSCGGLLNAPSEIFLKESLEILKESEEEMDMAMGKMSQQVLLVQNWGQVLFTANKGGPIDLESLEWDGIGTCPGCGQASAQEFSYELECIWCQADFWVNQKSISRTVNTNALCPSCNRSMVIPPTVWCQKCGRNIRTFEAFVRLFKEANQVVLQSQVDIPSMSKKEGPSTKREGEKAIESEARHAKKWWQFRR